MVKKRKLLAKLISGSKNVRFAEFTALIEAFGFILRRTSGSHHIFKHPNIPDLLSIQPDAKDQAKLYQIKQFLKLVEEYNLSLDTADDSEVDEDSE